MEDTYLHIMESRDSGNAVGKIPYNKLKEGFKKAFDNNLLWGVYVLRGKTVAEDIWGNIYYEITRPYKEA